MSSSINYLVSSPFSNQLVIGLIEDWRDQDGNLVSDGLPIIRIFKEQTDQCCLLRPYFLINVNREYVIDPETYEKIITFVSPLFNWKVMITTDGNRLKPVHRTPLEIREGDKWEKFSRSHRSM